MQADPSALVPPLLLLPLLLLPLLLLPPLLLEAPAPSVPDPPASSPPPPPLPLLQPLSPTVEEAPATTRTWKSLSILMGGSLPPTGLATTLVVHEIGPTDGVARTW
jgi:hypothetical protein